MLYEQYYNLFMSICNRYGNTTEEAEEMLNNGFLKIFVNIYQFEYKGSFEGWMKRIIVNGCLDYLKSKQVKSNKNSNLSIDNNEEGNYFDKSLFENNAYDESAFESKLDLEELEDLLKSLPEQTKTVFNLYVFEEYSHKDIGEQLGIAERTSQWHFRNAKKELIALFAKKNEIKKVIGL